MIEIGTLEELIASSKNRRRRHGIATAVCRACLTLNGITIGAAFYKQAGFWRCHSCGTPNITSVLTETVHTTNTSMQDGVQVHGIGIEK